MALSPSHPLSAINPPLSCLLLIYSADLLQFDVQLESDRPCWWLLVSLLYTHSHGCEPRVTSALSESVGGLAVRAKASGG